MNSSLLVVKTFNTRFEAEIAKGSLEANNIKAIILADDEGGAAPFPLQPSSTGARLMVNKKDFKKASLLLQ